MLRLPEPVGPITATLVDYLRGRSARIGPHAAVDDPLADRDLQLALYVASELHYAGVAGVDDELEWDPEVAGLRAALQRSMLERLREECEPVAPVPAGEIATRIFELIEADDAPPLARYLETRADLGQFKEFVIQRSAYQLKEADPHTFAIPRIAGPAKAAMIEIQADEYGGGDPRRMHSELFARTMAALGLDREPGGYVECLPATTLATVNLITLFALARRWRGALVGHLVGFEITSSAPNRRYANGLRRLGGGPAATEFYDEHVEADSVHEHIAAHDLAAGLAAQEPAVSGEILFGVESLLLCERLFAGHILESWEAGESSLVADPRRRPVSARDAGGIAQRSGDASGSSPARNPIAL
jgi:hypothetical protein